MLPKLCLLPCFLFIAVTSVATDSAKKESAKSDKGRQFPQLSFVLPIFASRNQGNLFGKSTVTRTLISTVSTVTVPSYRTCTMTMAAFPPCAGRRRRDTQEEENEADQYDQLIQVTPSIKVIIGKTEITDPEAVAEILHLKRPHNNDVNLDETTTLSVFARSGNNNDDATTVLYPSEEAAADENVLHLEDGTPSSVTTETPLFDETNDEERTTTDSLPLSEDEEEKARRGFGGSGQTTTTSTIPVTHVVSTAVTVAMSTLTVVYQGCSPPGPLPVIAPLC